MARDVQEGVAFYPGIDTEFDMMGDASSFSHTIINMSDGATVVNEGAGTFEELVRVSNGHTGTTSGTATAGSFTITLADDATLVVGDVIYDADHDNYYYITSVNGNVIGLKRPLVTDIEDSKELNQVGNTGLYKVECKISTPGEYMVTVAHPLLGNIALKYVIVEHTMDENYANNVSRFDAIDETLAKIGVITRMKSIL